MFINIFNERFRLKNEEIIVLIPSKTGTQHEITCAECP